MLKKQKNLRKTKKNIDKTVVLCFHIYAFGDIASKR